LGEGYDSVIVRWGGGCAEERSSEEYFGEQVKRGAREEERSEDCKRWLWRLDPAHHMTGTREGEGEQALA